MGGKQSSQRSDSVLIHNQNSETNNMAETKSQTAHDRQTRPGPGPGEIDVRGFRINQEDIIGSGTFGSVCQAHMIDTGEPIAAKGILVTDRWSQNDYLKSMAMEEGARMKLCSHRNIVKLYDYCEHGKKVWLFMGFCDLGDLNHHLYNNQELRFHEKLRIMNETTSAVSYLHNHYIVHRDIKPENILMKFVNNKPVVKLGDFGYAKIYDYTRSQPTFSTQINRSTAGTPAFWAPEFFLQRDNLGYTASVDIFSLGLIFAVVYKYGPTNKSTFPISLESRQKSNKEVYGREMAERFHKGQTLPTLVQIDASDDGIITLLKELISKMTMFKSNDRNSITEVETQLKYLQEPLDVNVFFNQILRNELRSANVVQLSDRPRSLNLIDKELWSCQVDGIAVFDENLNLLRNMPGHGDHQRVCSVTLLPDDTVAVAGAGRLYQSSKLGEIIQTISKDDYIDLAVYDAQLYATHLFAPTIHVFDCRTWKRLRSISTPCSDIKHGFGFYRHTICVNSTHITLSCWDCNAVYVFDLHGTFKQSHGPKITLITPSSSMCEDELNTEDSKLYHPKICQEDDDGAILVADTSNDRMLVLTAEGHWRRVRLNDDLQCPRSAVWWKGRLYVSTWDDEKITMFQ